MTKREAYRAGHADGERAEEYRASHAEREALAVPSADTERAIEDSRDPDLAWAAYDAGVAAGIKARRAGRQS